MISKTPLQSIEPLPVLARFAWEHAAELCDDLHGCEDYHRAWSLVRLLLRDGGAPAGQEFFQRELSGISDSDNPRILISGGADTGLMASIVACSRAIGSMPQIVFTDRCRTTIEQNKILAQHLGLDVEFYLSDIKDLEVEQVDFVIAHSFLGLFPFGDAVDVIRAWKRNLKFGGKILTSQNAYRVDGYERIPTSRKKIEARLKGLLPRARAFGLEEKELEELEAVATRFWTRKRSHPYYSETDLVRMFTEAGLNIVSTTYIEVTVPTGPLTNILPASIKRRAEIVAKKPDRSKA